MLSVIHLQILVAQVTQRLKQSMQANAKYYIGVKLKQNEAFVPGVVPL